MPRFLGGQSSAFYGIVTDVAQAKPPVWKCIDPDSDITAAIKSVSPNTVTIARIYTGLPTVDDVSQHPNAYMYGREYADYVWAHVKDPAHTDYIETENEPNDHYADLTRFIVRLNDFLIGFSDRAKQLGFKPLGPNFSTGYPEVFVKSTDYELWPNAWQGLVEGLRALKAAGGALSLHEYGWPDVLAGWSDTKQMGYLVGRHKAVYASLPKDLQDMPLFITEGLIDAQLIGKGGGFWYGREGEAAEAAPAWYVGQCRTAWERVYRTTPQLRGVCHFIHGNNNAELWEDYDTTKTEASRDTFVAFMQEDLPAASTAPPPQPGGIPMQLQMLTAAWNSIGRELDATGIPYNPTAAFVAKAFAFKIGPPTGREYRVTIDGVVYAFQCFRDAFLWCVEGDWDNAKPYDLLTAQPYVAPAPPPPPVDGTETAYQKAVDFLNSKGVTVSRRVPVPGEPFYRLTAATIKKVGNNASCHIDVYDAAGHMLYGPKCINEFTGAGGKGELIVLPADFNFGSSSAYDPTKGETTGYNYAIVDDDASRDEDNILHYMLKLSDEVHGIGDYMAQHTEWALAYTQIQ